jgi:hypothetical protein
VVIAGTQGHGVSCWLRLFSANKEVTTGSLEAVVAVALYERGRPTSPLAQFLYNGCFMTLPRVHQPVEMPRSLYG